MPGPSSPPALAPAVVSHTVSSEPMHLGSGRTVGRQVCPRRPRDAVQVGDGSWGMGQGAVREAPHGCRWDVALRGPGLWFWPTVSYVSQGKVLLPSVSSPASQSRSPRLICERETVPVTLLGNTSYWTGNPRSRPGHPSWPRPPPSTGSRQPIRETKHPLELRLGLLGWKRAESPTRDPPGRGGDVSAPQCGHQQARAPPGPSEGSDGWVGVRLRGAIALCSEGPSR